MTLQEYPGRKMTGRKAWKIWHSYQPDNKIYQVGPWFILINKNRQAQITSGDMWYDIPRKEAACWLKHGTPS